MPIPSKRLYSDSGNNFIAALIPSDVTTILDIGCGCGDTAQIIKRARKWIWIEGITFNEREAEASKHIFDGIHVFDIEKTSPLDIFERDTFDCLLFSHILEHLRDPPSVIFNFLPIVKSGGCIVAAVPNVLEWRTRAKLMLGKWEYADAGIFDRTHLRFYTYKTAFAELFGPFLGDVFSSISVIGDGAAPLYVLRRFQFMRYIVRWIDRMAVKFFPNLFSQQVCIIARKK